jgi:hypothetical protein
VVSFIDVLKQGGPGENHWPVASHWQTLLHNVVLSTPLAVSRIWTHSARIIYWKFKIYINITSNFEIQWDRYIVWLSLAYFLWLYSKFFIILYKILKIAELDCCQIIILSIYVPSTHAYTHVICLSLDLPYETR